MRLRTEWLGPPRVRAGLLTVLLVVGLVPVLSRGAQWLGSWKMALDHSTFSITLLGPVAAGITCAAYVRFRQSGVTDLLGQATRPWSGWIAPALHVWLLATLAVVLICAFATSATWATGAHAYPELFWVVPPALVVLGAEIAIGALVGSRIPHYWAVPWTGVTVFTLFILSSVNVIPGVFRTGGVSGSLAGETFVARPIWLQAAAALGFALVAMAMSSWDLFRVSSALHQVGVGVLLVGAITALFQLPGDTDLRYAPVSAVRHECREGRPTVCMLEETTRPLDDLATTMQRLAEPLVAGRVALPDRFVQSAPYAQDPASGAINLSTDEELGTDVSDEAAARSLSQPADCPAYYSSSPDAFPDIVFTIDRILVRWLLVQSGAELAPIEGGLAEWWAAPVEEQLPWVRETYDALRECRLFSLRLPS